MNGPTDQFVDNAHRSQEAVTAAVRTWSDAFQNYAGTISNGQLPLFNPHGAVNAAFDLATQMLAQQREFANTLLDAGTRTGEAMVHVSEAVAKAGTEAREAVTRAGTEAGNAVAKAGETVTGQVRGESGPTREPRATQSSNETPKRTRTERTTSV
jgi:hypothetical protein